jgi:hypothetical protein
MPSIATSIPIRVNGQRVYAGWWNILREWLIYLFGAGAIPETEFTLPNNQVSALDVTGLVFDSASFRGSVIEYDIYRKTDTASSEVRAIGEIRLVWRTETSLWELLGPSESGDFTGVTFSVTSLGQVQVTTTNISGANYIGSMRFRARTFDV